MCCLFLKIEDVSDETIRLQFSWVAHKDRHINRYLTDVTLKKNVPMIEQLITEEIFSKILGKYIFDDVFAQEIELGNLNGISEEIFDEICGICNVTSVISKEEFERKYEDELEELKYQRL